MCGICGFLAVEGSAEGQLEAVRRMSAAMVHRGPDASGMCVAGGCALGHRRLAIVDLSADGTQPMHNEDATISVVVNGEIYNHLGLREQLENKGHRFRSHSDSEVVLHLYEEYGEDCVARLDGMFAFAIYDQNTERLLLARDRSGKKPLFLRQHKHGLFFASELRALQLALPDDKPPVDLSVVDEFLTLRYVPSPHSIYGDIQKLPAAHYVVAKRGQLGTPVRYWQKPSGQATPFTGSLDEATAELRRLLVAAVRRRLMADVPLGAFLSGGLDSSTIVALMHSLSNAPVKTFSIGFPDADDSELQFARLMAKQCATEHHELVVHPELVTTLVDIVRHHGEPFADSSAIATYHLAKMTRQHVTVALSGDASDEAFAGYKRYGIARLGHLHDQLPSVLAPVARGALSLGGPFAPVVGMYAGALTKGEAKRYSVLVGEFTDEEKGQLYLAPMRDAQRGGVLARFEQVLAASGANSPMGRLIDLDWQTYLVDDINVKVDIASMAHSLEVRCPFLDTAVVEFAARLPSSLLHRRRGKFLLRRAMRGLVPDVILQRHKRGFALPLERWLRRDLKSFVRDHLLDRRARQRGLFAPAAVEKLLGTLDRSSAYVDRIWTLLCLELWFREFVDAKA